MDSNQQDNIAIISEKITNAHSALIASKEGEMPRKYKILKDYSGTYIEKEMQKEERLTHPIFRVFVPAKPSRDRKLNINLQDNFDPYSDSLLDYPSIIGYKLKKSWQFFNRHICVHLPLCPNNCWHCYVPKELYADRNLNLDKEEKHYEKLTSEEIVEYFFKQKDFDGNIGKYSNVLRITGGEPFLLPELILECLEKISESKYKDQVFLWTETNLEPFVGDFIEEIGKKIGKDILEELKKYKSNFAVHPCFHGLDKDEFDTITGKNYHLTLDQQMKGMQKLVSKGIDVYPTIGSNVCNPANLESFFKKLRDISPELPLKVALVDYKVDYDPVPGRFKEEERAKNTNIYSRFASIRIWNQLLLDTYGVGYGVIPRHLISLTKEAFKNDLKLSPPKKYQKEKPKNPYKYEKEILYLFKSSYRVQYHREILEYIALPEGAICEIHYDKKWVQLDLFFHIENAPKKYIGFKTILSYVDRNRGEFLFLPYREGKVIDVFIQGDILYMKLQVGNYISWEHIDWQQVEDEFTKYFGEANIPPGGKYFLIGESFIDDIDKVIDGENADETDNENKKKDKTSFETSPAFCGINSKGCLSFDSDSFQYVLTNIAKAKDMKKSLFYRININSTNLKYKKEIGGYEIYGEKSFKIVIEYFLPNYKEFDERDTMARSIHFKVSSPTIKPIGQDHIVLSKYGREELYFHTSNVEKEEEIVLSFFSKRDLFSAAKLDLKIRVRPQKAKKALYSLAGAALLTTATSGVSLVSKIPEKEGKLYEVFEDFIQSFISGSWSDIVVNFLFVAFLLLSFFAFFYWFPKGFKVSK